MTKALDLSNYLERFRVELLGSVLPFWLEHSLDKDCGGYFNCLDRDGTVYDTTKHMWLQCRQVWTLARLYNDFERRGQWLEAARQGLEFIRAHGRDPESGRVYFSVSREGAPVFIQRKIFAECFYIMALDEYARATGDRPAADEAREVFELVLRLRNNPAGLGRPQLSGQPATSALAVPMILLWVAEQLARDSSGSYDSLMRDCVEGMMLHVKPEQRAVFENVSPDGALLPGGEGRLLNPGHAIEAGWFMLERARRTGEESLAATAVSMIDWSFERGWDNEHGGLFYFLDFEGRPPFQLEWPMKLWWPHCEALIAFLLAYRHTGDDRWVERFERVFSYTFERFPDRDHGEWFGYLDREGRPTHTLKGGAYKGCFHVPRALMKCIELLESPARA